MSVIVKFLKERVVNIRLLMYDEQSAADFLCFLRIYGINLEELHLNERMEKLLIFIKKRIIMNDHGVDLDNVIT